MAQDLRKVNDIESLITYFSENLGWAIDPDDYYDIDDITYDFDAADLGLKEEAFAKITSLKQLRPLVDDQRWGIFFVNFESNRFEVSALRKILSGLIPARRNADHAVWDKKDLLFLCTWGERNKVTIGAAHFEDAEKGLPQIKMISCEPAVEDFTQINIFEQRLAKLAWPSNPSDTAAWHEAWASAFTTRYRQTIQDSHTLTIRLAEEAQNIRDRILNTLEIETSNGYVHLLFQKFRNTLVHDMTEQQFADMYAQTVVYGLFSARCMDESQEDFNASEAVECIPNTNPFLKGLLQECLGSNSAKSKLSFDELEVGNIVDLLLHTKTDSIITDFNRQTGGGREDPVIHFYEEFLSEYDKTQRVQRGVYYTPQPVVNFIVRAVDDILKHEFGIQDGLASTATKKIKYKRESKKRIDGYFKTMVEDEMEVPAIQILDPATGTGTFLRQTILQIYSNFCTSRKGMPRERIQAEWNQYVPEHLLPRLNGFELMMAPYAVAHMKLAMVLKDTGYLFDSNERLQVFLTNTLEKPGNSEAQLTLFDDPLAFESVSANVVKKNTGINIVIGNPPYNVSSSNKSPWILELLADYKQGLTERKLNLDDDYIKFIKYAQTIIEKSSSGILAYITNNSYIDGVSHRRIRESLMGTFEQIYVIDLHGNVMKQEKTSNGGKDENVFDITQGVSIGIFVKKKGLKRFVKQIDIMGLRYDKYDFLSTHTISDIDWKDLTPQKPEYLFIPYKYELKASYDAGFKVSDLFTVFNSGIQTKCDEISVCTSQSEANRIVNLFLSNDIETIKKKYPTKKDGRDWSFALAQKDIKENPGVIIPYYYRPFDVRYIRYSGVTKGLIAYPRRDTMNHVIGHDNLCLCLMKQFFQDITYNHVFATNLAIDERFLYSNRGGTYIFPLYLYSGEGVMEQKQYNFNFEIITKIEDALHLKLAATKDTGTFSGEDLMAYIYAILHNESYRVKYNDQLKYDFPSIPYPTSQDVFWALVEKGTKLFKLHLPDSFYREEKSNIIIPELKNYKFSGSDILLNNQYSIPAFEGVKNYQMGGYRPADKWLKDRKGKPITESDLFTYKKLISSMIATIEIMQEINDIITF